MLFTGIIQSQVNIPTATLIKEGATLNLEVDQTIMSLYEKEMKVLKIIGVEK